MKVTVGAIRQIVREEADRLHETEEAEPDAGSVADAGSVTDAGLLSWVKGELLGMLDPIKDQWNDELKKSITLLIKSWENPQVAKQLDRKIQAVVSDEGSSHTSGYEDGKASDEGSSQTSGFRPDGSGRASNEAIGRAGLRNLIMQEASSIVGE